jgi:serine/threonine-protein kinase
LYGRDDDLAWLEDRREKAKRAVVGVRLVGEPGMGKTRLLQDFLRHAESQGDRVAFTGPDPYGAEVGYWAVREAVSQLARLDPDDIANKRFAGANDDAREGLVKLFDSRAPAKGTAPVERRFLVAEALRWAVQVAADEVKAGAVVLAVDDLQRVDGGSRSAFADLLGDPPGCGVLVIGTHTPGFDSGWAADVASGRTLSGLPPPTVQRLLRPSRPGDLDRMLSDERGVSPMYVDQLLRYQLEGGTDPPARLGDLIALRVDTIEPNSRRVLQAVAVLGDRVDTASIALLLPKGHDLQAGIAKLMSAGMVEQSSSGVSCSHPLLRDIVLAGIPHAVRRELHGKALRVSEKGGAPIEVSAQHAYYAQDSFQALLLLEQAAERAAARGDTASEVLALRRGVEVARQEISRGELDDPLRAVLIFSRKLGASLTRAGNFADAEGVLREALDLAGPTSPDRARVLGALAHVAHGRRREQEAMGYIDQAIEAAKQSGSNDLVTALTDTRRAWAS